ncbi:MAG: DUF4199 domain-containing protein [Bacteroidales bacterium]
MENKNMTPGKIALNYGLIFGIIVVVYSLVIYILGVDMKTQKWLGYGNFVILIIGMILGVKAYRDKYLGGYISYGKSFTTVFLIGLFAMVIVSIYNYVYMTVINPGFMEEILRTTEETILESNPNMTDAQIDQALEMTQRFSKPWLSAIWSFVGGTLITLIISLILAAFFVKKDKSMEGVA